MALVPEPVTKKEVRRYIGGTAFYSHMVDNYAGLCAPMHRCTKNDVPDGDIRGYCKVSARSLPYAVFDRQWRHTCVARMHSL